MRKTSAGLHHKRSPPCGLLQLTVPRLRTWSCRFCTMQAVDSCTHSARNIKRFDLLVVHDVNECRETILILACFQNSLSACASRGSRDGQSQHSGTGFHHWRHSADQFFARLSSRCTNATSPRGSKDRSMRRMLLKHSRMHDYPFVPTGTVCWRTKSSAQAVVLSCRSAPRVAGHRDAGSLKYLATCSFQLVASYAYGVRRVVTRWKPDVEVLKRYA